MAKWSVHSLAITKSIDQSAGWSVHSLTSDLRYIRVSSAARASIKSVSVDDKSTKSDRPKIESIRVVDINLVCHLSNSRLFRGVRAMMLRKKPKNWQKQQTLWKKLWKKHVKYQIKQWPIRQFHLSHCSRFRLLAREKPTPNSCQMNLPFFPLLFSHSFQFLVKNCCYTFLFFRLAFGFVSFDVDRNSFPKKWKNAKMLFIQKNNFFCDSFRSNCRFSQSRRLIGQEIFVDSQRNVSCLESVTNLLESRTTKNSARNCQPGKRQQQLESEPHSI